MGDIDLRQVDEATAGKFFSKLNSNLPKADVYVTRYGRPVRAPSGGKHHMKGGHRCGKYFLFTVKSLIAVTLIGVGKYAGVAAITGATGWTAASVAALREAIGSMCTGNILGFTPFQAGFCGLILKLQKELVDFLLSQDFGTIKTAIAGAVAAAGVGSAWSAIKGVYEAVTGTIDQMANDFCNKFYPDPKTADASVQTVSVASETAGAAVAAEAARAPPDAVDQAEQQAAANAIQGGRRRRRTRVRGMTKKHKTSKSSTRKLSFRY